MVRSSTSWWDVYGAQCTYEYVYASNTMRNQFRSGQSARSVVDRSGLAAADESNGNFNNAIVERVARQPKKELILLIAERLLGGFC